MKPVLVEAHKRYYWCSCGLSQTQPFCDGAHKGTPNKPLPYVSKQSKTVHFCECKHSANKPLCDGSHMHLK